MVRSICGEQFQSHWLSSKRHFLPVGQLKAILLIYNKCEQVAISEGHHAIKYPLQSANERRSRNHVHAQGNRTNDLQIRQAADGYVHIPRAQAGKLWLMHLLRPFLHPGSNVKARNFSLHGCPTFNHQLACLELNIDQLTLRNGHKKLALSACCGSNIYCNRFSPRTRRGFRLPALNKHVAACIYKSHFLRSNLKNLIICDIRTKQCLLLRLQSCYFCLLKLILLVDSQHPCFPNKSYQQVLVIRALLAVIITGSQAPHAFHSRQIDTRLLVDANAIPDDPERAIRVHTTACNNLPLPLVL
mmetsp:Transcript_1474/g.2433  ORF Transcript_1474/g.2433 Transcript_1474/m.2433 type:complete len:301 (+) Transcript_1474:672-1574(+)